MPARAKTTRRTAQEGGFMPNAESTSTTSEPVEGQQTEPTATEPTNADALIGEVAVVTEKISNIEARGLVKIRGQIWSAKSADGVDIDKDEKVSIISIEGVKLVCRKTENN